MFEIRIIPKLCPLRLKVGGGGGMSPLAFGGPPPGPSAPDVFCVFGKKIFPHFFPLGLRGGGGGVMSPWSYGGAAHGHVRSACVCV